MTDIIAVVEIQNDATVAAVGIQGLSGQATTISTISDVDAVLPANGSVLVYKTNTSKWTATTLLDEQNMEGGFY